MLTSHSEWWDINTYSTRKLAIRHLELMKQKGESKDYRIVCFKSYSGMFLHEYIIDNKLNKHTL